MKLNKLSFQTEEEKEALSSILWFELLIDDEPVEKFIGKIKAIPYYYLEEHTTDLPYQFNYENKKLYLLGVCI